jgi:2-oxoglutarate dehydrogenase E1 component
VRTIHDQVQSKLNEDYEAAKDYKPQAKDWLASHWQGFMSPAQMSRIRNTGACMGVGGGMGGGCLCV